MSIEKAISDLTAAVTALTAAMNAKTGVTTVPQAPAAAQAPVAAPQAPAMPAPPMFAPPVAAAPVPAASQVPAATGAPFNDGAGLINYVMAVYKEIGPVKGANIQGVLTSLGYQNINDVKPEHYAQLYQGVEALKRG